MDIENICNLLLEALAEAGFNESTLFNYRGVYADSKPFAMKETHQSIPLKLGRLMLMT